MKMKFVFGVACIVIASVALTSCEEGNSFIHTSSCKISYISDYLYEYEAEDYASEAPSEVLTDYGPIPIFGCSSVRNGNFYGRNLDFNINEICEFVVRTKATATRKHASIGVANPIFLTLTNEKVRSGLSKEELDFIPWMTMDGINDAGLVCNVNVLNMWDIKDAPHTQTNPGKPQIMVMNLVRALLDNCGSVEEAKTFIENHDITAVPMTWDCHLMIADPQKTVIVEFTGKEDSMVIYTEDNIMTNFYNYQFKRDGDYPQHVCGMERHQILTQNYNISNSMEGMWELLKKVRYTQTYKVDTDPFWCSEYYDTPKIPTFDEYDRTYWTTEKVLEQEKPRKEIEAYKVYEQTGKYDPDDNLWFTTHNSTYDIANKTLWVTIREKYEKHYEFKLKTE